MRDIFEFAAGTIIGKHHVKVAKNNQDAFYCSIYPDLIVGVVCDGCGSTKHSEVGAAIGASMIVEEINRSGWGDGSDPVETMECVRQNVLKSIHNLAKVMHGPLVQVIKDYFLFTAVVAVIDREDTHIFSIGDGAYIINGVQTNLGPFSRNAPPYICYSIIEDMLSAEFDCRFKLNQRIDTKDLNSLLIATDGIEDFNNAEEKYIPGKPKKIGPISQFWTEDIFFKNRLAVNRKLNLTNREVVKLSKDIEAPPLERISGHLRDDTTLVVVRRKVEEEIKDGDSLPEGKEDSAKPVEVDR